MESEIIEVGGASSQIIDRQRRLGWVRPSHPTAVDDPPPRTFEEAIIRVRTQKPVHPYAYQVVWAFNCMAEVFGRDSANVPTDVETLRPLIANALPATASVSQKRWARARSLVTTYLRRSGVELEPGREVAGHSQAWADLMARASMLNRLPQSRFASFCTRLGVEPSDVTVATFDLFANALQSRSLKENYEAISRNTVTHWNRCVAEVEGWPTIVVPQARHARYFSEVWQAYPASFQAEVNAFLARGEKPRRFSKAYRRPIRSITASLYRRQLRVAASLLVESGFPIEQLTSLKVLVTIENVERLTEQHIKRRGQKVSGSLVQCAELLVRAAVFSECDDTWVRMLKVGASNLARDRTEQVGARGMVKRNRERLRQFDLRSNRKALLALPDVVFAQARQTKVDVRVSRRVMLAMAVELELATALRGSNLSTLEINRHFNEVRRGRSSIRHVVIPASEMKGKEEFEMALPARTVALLDEYLTVYHPVLSPEISPYLFPNRFGKKRDGAHFAKSISDFIRLETGIKMHLHLFRHFAVKLHLEHNPEDIESARRFLQHKSSRITLGHYAEVRSERANARWHATLDAERRGSSEGDDVRPS